MLDAVSPLYAEKVKTQAVDINLKGVYKSFTESPLIAWHRNTALILVTIMGNV